MEKIRNKLHDLGAKLRDTHLEDVEAHLSHKKHQIGKLANVFNQNHRHDEPKEIACDEKRSRICRSHRYESFFPERDGNQVKWYVDGRDYFWAVSVALERARETIYIADWWLSPELFLRRPPSDHLSWRLDQVLKRRAEAGVQIFVVVYREVAATLTCNSQHTKHALHALCPPGSPGHGNIRVMRHPDHNVFENAADMTFRWAHHEKFIVIDYELAFIGGLDLCFGRWDMHQHPLADVHPEGVSNEIWPGQDFNNNRIMDFKKVEDWKQNELSKAEYGRMPWHDVAFAVAGPSVYDIAEHFVLRWNFIKRDKYKRDSRYDWITLSGREGPDREDLVGVQRPHHPVGLFLNHPLTQLDNLRQPDSAHATARCQLVRSSADWSSGVLMEHSIQTAWTEVIARAEHYVYIENQFFITATGDRQGPIFNTIGRAIVDAVVRAAHASRKFRVIVIIPAVPGFAGDLREDAAMGTRTIMDYQYKSICRGEHSIFGQIRAAGVDPTLYIFFFNLRSYDRLNRTPAVIETELKTGVSYQQVQRAHAEEVMREGIHGTYDPSEASRDKRMGSRHEQKSSHVSTGTGPSDALDIEANADGKPKSERQTEMREGSAALQDAAKFEQTKREIDAESDRHRGQPESPEQGRAKAHAKAAYTVAHHAMAGTGPVSDEPWDDADLSTEVQNWIQEELYIHSKLLIVDDRIVVCGSSNLNDRSMLGDHDSELSIVIEDGRVVPSVMAGQPFDASWTAASLRRQLWREHMGLLPPQPLDAANNQNAMPPGDGPDGGNDADQDQDSWRFVEDPLSDELWQHWTEQADRNTTIFRELFHTDPDDHVKTFDDYNRFMASKGVKPGHIFDQFMAPEDVRAKLDQIKGHLIRMPLDFLRDAQMAEKGLLVNEFTENVYT